MKPRITGVRIDGQWRYAATCNCGWHYISWDLGWDFAVTIATAHTYLKSLKEKAS